MASCTRARVSARSRSGLFRALETVWRETPASSATVASVGALGVRPDIGAPVASSSAVLDRSNSASMVAARPHRRQPERRRGTVGALTYGPRHEHHQEGPPPDCLPLLG